MKSKKIMSSTVGSYCLSFRSIAHKKILKWVENFVQKTNFTGHLAFDFIELDDGRLFAIECNPRTTSGICLFSKEDRIDRAYFINSIDRIDTQTNTQKQIAIANLLFGWQSALACHKFPLYLSNIFKSQDVIFNKKDLRPFFMQPLLWINQLCYSLRVKKNVIEAFTYDVDFNG